MARPAINSADILYHVQKNDRFYARCSANGDTLQYKVLITKCILMHTFPQDIHNISTELKLRGTSWNIVKHRGTYPLSHIRKRARVSFIPTAERLRKLNVGILHKTFDRK